MTKKRLNISGKVELVDNSGVDMNIDSLTEYLKKVSYISTIYVEDKNRSNKFKLGHEEKKVSFNMKVNNEYIGVSSIIHLGYDKSEILAIETFSGVNHFIDIEEYEKTLKNLLQDFTKEDVLFEFSITGISSNI